MKTTCLLFLTMSWATLSHEAVLCPLPLGESVPRSASSAAGAPHRPVQGGVGGVSGHRGPASQKVNRPKQIPNSRQRSLPGNAMDIHRPSSGKSGSAARGVLIRDKSVNNVVAVRTPNVVRPTAPSFNNVRHRNPNPAVVGGSANSQRSNTGTINGTRMNRKP
jgi:hypothetical protein